jgi:hypothetical protein
MPKSITLGTGAPSCSGHQHIRRLQVTVDHPLLVRMADGATDKQR